MILLLTTIPLAITELGTDSWISDLMSPEMALQGLEPGWVLVYTSAIMLVLRFCTGPIVHRVSPLGLLLLSSLLAMAGPLLLSRTAGALILVTAGLSGVGKTFLWPTTMGVVAELFPKGGALAINSVSAVGMMAVGVFGNALLGAVQDGQIDARLRSHDPALYQRLVGEERHSLFGSYRPLDPKKVEELSQEERVQVKKVQDGARKSAPRTVALFPLVMFVSYSGLWIYFRRRGVYQAVDLGGGQKGGWEREAAPPDA